MESFVRRRIAGLVVVMSFTVFQTACGGGAVDRLTVAAAASTGPVDTPIAEDAPPASTEAVDAPEGRARADIVALSGTAHWRSDEPLSPIERGSAVAPSLAANARGDAVVVWQQTDGERERIAARRYRAGAAGWDAPGFIDAPDGGDGFQPRVSLDPAGRALVVWTQRDASGYPTVQSNRSASIAGPWLARPVQIGTGAHADLSLGADPATGHAVAIWNAHTAVRATVFDAHAGRWLGVSELAVNGTRSGQFEQLRAHIGADGHAIALWVDGRTGFTRLEGARFDPAALAWTRLPPIAGGEEFRIVSKIDIAFDGKGDALIGWTFVEPFETPAGNFPAISVRTVRWSRASGTLGEPCIVDADTMRDDALQRVAIDPEGRVFVIWKRQDPGQDRPHLYAKRFRASGAPGLHQRVDGALSGDAEDASIAFDPAGGALLVWAHFDGANTLAATHADIAASRFDPATDRWSAAAVIEKSAGSAEGAQVALVDGGRAWAVWTQAHATGTGIWNNRFR